MSQVSRKLPMGFTTPTRSSSHSLSCHMGVGSKLSGATCGFATTRSPDTRPLTRKPSLIIVRRFMSSRW